MNLNGLYRWSDARQGYEDLDRHGWCRSRCCPGPSPAVELRKREKGGRLDPSGRHLRFLPCRPAENSLSMALRQLDDYTSLDGETFHHSDRDRWIDRGY